LASNPTLIAAEAPSLPPDGLDDRDERRSSAGGDAAQQHAVELAGEVVEDSVVSRRSADREAGCRADDRCGPDRMALAARQDT
jgi:hypothetical protein